MSGTSDTTLDQANTNASNDPLAAQDAATDPATPGQPASAPADGSASVAELVNSHTPPPEVTGDTVPPTHQQLNRELAAQLVDAEAANESYSRLIQTIKAEQDAERVAHATELASLRDLIAQKDQHINGLKLDVVGLAANQIQATADGGDIFMQRLADDALIGAVALAHYTARLEELVEVYSGTPDQQTRDDAMVLAASTKTFINPVITREEAHHARAFLLESLPTLSITDPTGWAQFLTEFRLKLGGV